MWLTASSMRSISACFSVKCLFVGAKVNKPAESFPVGHTNRTSRRPYQGFVRLKLECRFLLALQQYVFL